MSLASHSGAPGIRFNDSMFTEPVPISTWSPPRYAGILTILVHDAEWAPKALQPVYFGEFGNNAPLSALMRDYSCFVTAAHGRTLYVSVLPMPFSTIAERRSLREELISAYNPACQSILLAGLGPQTLRAQPEAPRRRIGFMPDTRTAA
jgi:hypothetical protein